MNLSEYKAELEKKGFKSVIKKPATHNNKVVIRLYTESKGEKIGKALAVLALALLESRF